MLELAPQQIISAAELKQKGLQMFIFDTNDDISDMICYGILYHCSGFDQGKAEAKMLMITLSYVSAIDANNHMTHGIDLFADMHSMLDIEDIEGLSEDMTVEIDRMRREVGDNKACIVKIRDDCIVMGSTDDVARILPSLEIAYSSYGESFH